MTPHFNDGSHRRESHLERLTEQTLLAGAQQLARRDPDLAAVIDRCGPPPLWAREPGFPTLVRIILEQQVSLASARAAFEKLALICNPLTPHEFLTLDDLTLKQAGFSRQKSRYCRHLAQAVASGELDLAGLHHCDDAAVHAALVQIKGIGTWTANIYLLMALRRPDVWPRGDLALAKAAQEVKNLPHLPSNEELNAISEPWRPWRAVAARLLWHHYLSKNSR